MRTVRAGAGIFLLVVAMWAGGCGPDLGECDEEAARRVVYDEDGLPAYEGQALLQVSCGNGAFCHSERATGAARFGAPRDVSFDMNLAAASDAPAEAAVARLGAGQQDVIDYRDEIYCTVDDGTMPPWGDATVTVHENVPRYARVAADGSRTRLPHVDTFEGLDILRTWLACGAPVVERTEGTGTVGDVVPAL